MSGSLIKIDEEIVTSTVATVSLLGIDTTYDVYKIVIEGWKSASNNVECRARVTEGGTPNGNASYDRAGKGLISTSSFFNRAKTNQNDFRFDFIGTADSQAQSNMVLYLFNFASTTEYAFITYEISNLDYNGSSVGTQGGQVFTETGTARDGMNFGMSSGNTTAGKFQLYGLKK